MAHREDYGTPLAMQSQVGTSPAELWHIPNLRRRASPTTTTHAVGTVRLYPFEAPRGGTIDRLAIEVTASGAGRLGRLGVYAATSVTNIYPSALLYDSGSLDWSANSIKVYTPSIALTPRRLHWLAVETSVGTVTLRSFSAAAGALGFLTSGLLGANGITLARAFAALPNPFTAGGALASSLLPPVFYVRFSA